MTLDEMNAMVGFVLSFKDLEKRDFCDPIFIINL